MHSSVCNATLTSPPTVQVFEVPPPQPVDPSMEPVKVEPPAADTAVKVNGREWPCVSTGFYQSFSLVLTNELMFSSSLLWPKAASCIDRSGRMNLLSLMQSISELEDEQQVSEAKDWAAPSFLVWPVKLCVWDALDSLNCHFLSGGMWVWTLIVISAEFNL